MASRWRCSPRVNSPALREYNAFVSGRVWSRIMVCLVVLRASGRGGFVGFAGFVAGFVVEAGVGVVGVGVEVEVVGCFPRRRRVTGMNDDAADA